MSNIPEQELPLYAKAIIVYAIVATIYIYYLRTMPPNVVETHIGCSSGLVQPTTLQTTSQSTTLQTTSQPTTLQTTSQPTTLQISTNTTSTSESPSIIERITSFFSSKTSTNISQQTKI